MATSKKTSKKSPPKKVASRKAAKPAKKAASRKAAKSAKKAASRKAAKSAKKAASKKAPAKKVAKSVSKSPARKSAATASKTASKKAASKTASSKKATTAKSGRSSSARAAGRKAAAPAAKKKAGGKAPAKKANDVPRSKSATTDGSTPVIPPEYDYLHDKAWLAAQREALLRERASYTSSADRLAAEAAALMADREPGDVQFDEESGEGDTIAVERDRDLALSAAARQSVADIDAALTRLDNKSYGICVVGQDIIPRERLEAIPEASVCVTHKTLMF